MAAPAVSHETPQITVSDLMPEPEGDDMDALRAAYEVKTGRAPHGNMKREKLLAALGR